MARRGGGVRRDVFMNRYRGEITIPVASTTLVQVTFNTGMNLGSGEKRKWVVYGFSLMPRGIQPAFIDAAAINNFCAQLCVGTPSDLLDFDDVQLIAQANRCALLSTAVGTDFQDWPLRAHIPYPIPVFANQLTVQCDAVEDRANLNGIIFGFQIDYLTAGIGDSEIAEYFQAYGGL